MNYYLSRTETFNVVVTFSIISLNIFITSSSVNVL